MAHIALPASRPNLLSYLLPQQETNGFLPNNQWTENPGMHRSLRIKNPAHLDAISQSSATIAL